MCNIYLVYAYKLSLFENSLEALDEALDASLSTFRCAAAAAPPVPSKETFNCAAAAATLYPQKGVLYPCKILSYNQSHCTYCLSPCIFHHQTLNVVALTARKHALISLPPLYC